MTVQCSGVVILDERKKRNNCATRAQVRFPTNSRVLRHRRAIPLKMSTFQPLHLSMVRDFGLDGLDRFGGMRNSLMDLFDMTLELVFATEVNVMVFAFEKRAL